MKGIKEAREAAGLSQEAAGHQLGVTRQTMKNWEDGVTEPSISLVRAMALLFHCSIDDLIKEG